MSWPCVVQAKLIWHQKPTATEGRRIAQDDGIIRVIVDAGRLPPRWPTHAHLPEFWEELGRTVATFGFFEEVLAKAVFAYTGTRRYAPEDIEKVYVEWASKVEHVFSDTLV